jgi:2-hydroxy fatty acid dioxygenase
LKLRASDTRYTAEAMGKWLESSFAFYASYHNNGINQLIHIICVWPILWSAQIFLAYTPVIATLPSPLSAAGAPINVNSGFIVSSFYIVYYLLIEQPAGIIAAALVYGGFFMSNELKAADPEVWKVALVVHIGCWIAQFLGHGVFEGRSPALFDNLFQALIMAPLFVLMEVLFRFGYKREFLAKVQVIVDKNIQKFKDDKLTNKKA